ncbi:DUF5020 family protein [Azoarcus sp. KH32C]|uniref:DUF5020 family protein n=1 Tax=Azoarcus sp. KH32C TaxID=748247 RepID=UPI0002385C95|nr:DUF5020 family protein [Azoarcus sp. KH32C]BAL26910.1 hypothetical protein AZKH_p0027 [Azoarcus sp. KH32C]
MKQLSGKIGLRRVGAVIGGILAFVIAGHLGSAVASEWSETDVQVLNGTRFRDPGIHDEVTKTTITLQHVSGYAYGRNYFFIDSYWGTKNAPRANDIYGEYYHYLSLGKTTGATFGGSVLKDVSLTAGVNAGATTGGAGTRILLYGVTLDFTVPGFSYLNVDLLAYDDRSQFNGVQTHYRNSYQVTPVWRLPFSIGGTQWSFEGFCDFIGARGQGTVNQTLCQPQLRFDLGQLVSGRRDAIYVGTEYQYWRNKYGIEGLNESFPNIMMVVKF